MTVVSDLIIEPTALVGFPKQLLANWDRKVETETAYLTSINTESDGTEKRKGLKVRPRRFISARLTGMDYRETVQLKNFQMRTTGQVVPYPIYSDITQATFDSNVFFGNFKDTRFFVGGRLIHFTLDYKGVKDVASYVISKVCQTFVIVTTTVVDIGVGNDYIAPLIDADIELSPASELVLTDNKNEIDINVNEKMDESGLVPTLTPSRVTEFFDDFSSSDTIEYPPLDVRWDLCGGTTFAADLTEGYLTDAAGWLCVGGIWARCHDSGLGAIGVPTDPEFLQQFDPVPSDCGDLVGIRASDDFGGTEDNSGVVAGKYYKVRWVEVSSNGTVSISTGSVVMAMGGSTGAETVQNQMDALAGDFEIVLDYDDFSSIPTTSGLRVLRTYFNLGGSFIEVEVGYNGSYGYRLYSEGGWGSWSSYSTGEGVITLTRAGSTVTAKIGSTTINTWTDAGDLIDVHLGAFAANGSSSAFSVSFASITLKDGSGNDVYIDPTGGSC